MGEQAARAEALRWLRRQWRFERVLEGVRREGDRVDEARAPQTPPLADS